MEDGEKNLLLATISALTNKLEGVTMQLYAAQKTVASLAEKADSVTMISTKVIKSMSVARCLVCGKMGILIGGGTLIAMDEKNEVIVTCETCEHITPLEGGK